MKLLLSVLCIFHFQFLVGQKPQVVYKLCEKQDAINVKCYDELTNEVTQNGKVRRHEKLLVKVEQIEGACSFIIPEFSVLIVPPDDSSDSQNNIDKGKMFEEPNFELPPYSIKDIGKVTIYVFPLNQHIKVANPETCELNVEYSKPTVALEGGSEEYYSINKETSISCYAKDLNQEDGNAQDLTFNWKCSVIKGADTSFCEPTAINKFKGRKKIVIPASVAKRENAFSLSVEVGLSVAPSYTAIAKQSVYFGKKETINKLEIECIKNCVPKSETTLSTLPVILKAICINCGLTEITYLFWTIKDAEGAENVDYSKLKSRKGNEFYLKAGTLNDNKKYKVVLEVTGQAGSEMSTEFDLFTRLPSPVKDCAIDPQTGTAFDTAFEISCAYFPGMISFGIFAVKDGKTTLIKKTQQLEGQSFTLPAGVSVLLNITNEQLGYTQSINLNVNVKEMLDLSSKKSNSDIQKEVGNKLDEVLQLSDQDPEMALQGVAAVVNEFPNLPPDKKDMVNSLNQKVISTMKVIDLNSPARAQQVVDILSHITESYTESDPTISAQTTELCTEASKVLMNQAKSAKNPELMRTEVSNSMKALAGCSQAGLKENKQSVEASTVKVNVPTTEYPLLPMQNQPENYPDYTDDEKSADNMAQFEKSAESMKSICFSNAKMLILTMVPEEDPIITEQGDISIIAARMYCHEAGYKKIETPDVIIQPSSVECRVQEIPILDVSVCITNKNPFWYIDNIPLITGIVYVKFTGSKHPRSIMDTDVIGKSRFSISLTSEDVASDQLKIHNAPLPAQSIAEVNENMFYDIVSIHRIFVMKNQGFTVTFQNMPTDSIYDITITNFEKPTYAYFKTSHKRVTPANNILDMVEIAPYDNFWYLSVLRNSKTLPSSDSIYSFSVTTTGCYSWNDSTKHWEFACPALIGKKMSTRITCLCNEGFIFTGFVRDCKVNLIENFKIQFQLELTFCWVIYFTVLSTFLLFSSVLFFASFERADNILDKIYFVGDIPSFYQYAYIVVIKTGNKKRAGTTSNITMKLYGTQGNSLEHVLNYPDPELVMMQRDSEIWYVLATEHLLGDIVKVEIWFDSIGNNTKWYCNKIDIYDIQENKSWKFDVDQWFDITQQDHNKFTILPTKKEEAIKNNEAKSKRIIGAIKTVLGKMEHEVNMWNLFIKDPLLAMKERTFLIFLSTIVMYLISMSIYAQPRFDESDSIGEYRFGFYPVLIWNPIVSNVVSFLICFPIIYLIKRRKIGSTSRQRSHQHIITNIIMTLCWTLTIIITSTSITLLIICGFWIPMDTSLLWLVSVLLGIVFNILIMQNISCIIYVYFLKLSWKVQPFIKTTVKVIEYVELQRAWIYKRFGALALRPYLKHLYFNLDSISIKEKYKWEETKLKIKEILEDLLMISTYVTLLYIVLMLDREPQAVYNHNEVKKLVLGKAYGKETFFRSISTIEDFASDLLLPTVQAIQWYGKFVQENPGMTKDFSNKYLGIIRLRQHRTKQIQCNLPSTMKFINVVCRPDYKVLKEFRNFSRGWAPASDISNITTERMGNVWKYSDSKFTGTSPYVGEYGVYPGGGYVAPLGRNFKNSLINMEYLKKHRWLDLRTRVVFVEFLTYNPNVNLFNSVTVVFEINSAGYILMDLKIQTRKLLMIDKGRIFTKKIISSSFGVVIFGLFVRIVYKLSKKKLMYFYDIWSTFDVFIVFLSGLSIYLYYARMARLYNYISLISEAKNNEFVNYFHLFNADNTLTTLTATLVFVATLRLWKLLRFMIIIKITEKTLKDSWVPLLVCLIYQMIYMMAFSTAGVLFFSPLSQDFRTFRSSFTTLLLVGLNLYPGFDTDYMNEHPLGITLYTLSMMFSLLFLTIYIAIISLYYADAKDFYADETSSVQKFVREKWVYYKTLMKAKVKKLRGGEDIPSEDLLIKPKSGDRYEDCLTIARNRMDGMALVTMCVLRNLEDHRLMTEKDFDLISQTIKALFGEESSEKEIFFTIGDSHHIKFVDDRRIIKLAELCEHFVKECAKVPRVSRKQEKTLMEDRIERIDSMIDNVEMIKSILDNIRIDFK